MKLSFFGAVKEVTGANYLIETGDTKILIDCGLKQGGSYCDESNWAPFAFNPEEISAVLITHAHIDHVGLLPRLVKEGFEGKIYSTPPTKDFANLLLLDSENILFKEAEKIGKKPLYAVEDVEKLMAQWEGVKYYADFRVGDAEITFYNAGHILGSSIITIEIDGKVIAFTGDLGNNPPPVIKGTDFLENADYCVIESAYGNKAHEPVKEGVIENLIEDVAREKGVLMIPAFAIERTQKLLHEMNDLFREERVPKVPVFLDSPLAIQVTDVYKKYKDYFNDEALQTMKKQFLLFDFPELKKTLDKEESKAINEVPAPKVIIAGSGMSQGGRILHHEKRYLPDPKSTILFVGYQTKGSLGRRIKDGEPMVRIHDEDVRVRCHIVSLEGYSAHADQRQLLEWLFPMRFNLRKVFVVQGDEEGSSVLATKITDELAVHAEIPKVGKVYKL